MMLHQLDDKFLKEMAELHPEDFVRLAFPNKRFEVLSAQVDKELVVRSRLVDMVMIIRTSNGRQVIHSEFKRRYTRNVLKQVFGYAGGLTIKYNLDVTTILYLTKPPSRGTRDLGLYQVRPFDEPTNQFSFKVVRLWEFLDAILAGDSRLSALVPLLPELVEKPDLALLHRQRELILAQNDVKRQAEAVFYTLAFGERYFPQELLRSLFKEDHKMYEHWERVPIFGDRIKQRFKEGEEQGLQQGLQQGRQQGLHEGLALALQGNILAVLNNRFGVKNGKVARLVGSIEDPKKLQAIFLRSLQTPSVDTIMVMLEKAKSVTRRKINRSVN